jgi:hypothetical protein
MQECGSEAMCKNGLVVGKQRYLCKLNPAHMSFLSAVLSYQSL